MVECRSERATCPWIETLTVVLINAFSGEASPVTATGRSEMVRRTKARFVFLSYSSEGLMARRDILHLMSSYGEVDVKTKRYPRFRADVDGVNRRYKADNVNEYLFRLKKRA